MKNKTTTILIGLGIILTTSLLLLLKRKENEEQEPEQEKESAKENQPQEDKNKEIVNEVLRGLVENEEFSTAADLLVNLIQGVVEKTKDVDILYDTPKNIEELIEALRMINLYDRFEEILRENEK